MKRFHEAILVGPSGNSWNVEVEEVGGALYFSRGWKKFVKDHSLKDGDFLVFYYDGDTHFLNKIFDKTGCEREDAFDVKCSEKHGSVVKNIPKSPLTIVKASENLLCIAEKQWSPKKWHDTYILIASTVTNKQKARAIQKAQSFRTNCPHFVVVMMRSLVPCTFMVYHTPSSKREKFMACKDDRDRGVIRISSGWKKFTIDNNLKEGDACVFVLSRATNDTFNKHIFRA
ncbi:hypothetical protein AMTRI_Chr01g135800 [Amborella trichopoda]